MQRRIIVVGDSPACGGAVLPYECHPVSTIMGHRVALMGGRVLCAACHGVGHIAKAGGAYRPTLCDAEKVLEGDVVICGCPVPQPLVSSQQSMSTSEDRSGVEGIFSAASMGADWYCPNPQALISSKKVVDGFVTYPGVKDTAGNICPNMTDDAFFELMLDLRDRAVKLIEKRVLELSIWNVSAKHRVRQWFGKQDDEIRTFLQSGLKKGILVLKGLDRKNFIKYTDDFGSALGCSPGGPPNQAAAVCKTNVATHTIAVTDIFCVLRPTSGSADSKMSVLVHEMSHFIDVFATEDLVYYMGESLKLAEANVEAPRRNADSFAGYIVWDMAHPD